MSTITSSRKQDEHDEIINLTKEALELANTAVQLDKRNNIIGACEYYDLAILNLDEIINNILPFSKEYQLLLDIRTKYDDRLEELREYENSKYDLSFAFSDNNSNKEFNNEESIINKDNNRKSSKFQKRRSLNIFEDLNITLENQVKTDIKFELPPTSPFEVPFWQLLQVRNCIEEGCFLTPKLFVSKNIWTKQYGLKFSGIAIKTSAFQHILALINMHLFTISLDQIELLSSNSKTNDDENSIILEFVLQANISLKVIHDHFIILQNQLSKPFPFIKENIIVEEQLKEVIIDEKLKEKNNLNASVMRFTNIITNVSKNVRKIAEVGYSRLGTIPVKTTDEEFAIYVALKSNLCFQLQIFNKWYAIVSKLKINLMNGLVDDKVTIILSKIKLFDILLLQISIFIKDVVCEIVLQDMETLIQRYLKKTRKSFSRMIWDEEALEQSIPNLGLGIR